MTDGGLETRRAVSVALRRPDGLVLAVRRPEGPDEELPGVWGLPAVTLHAGEPAEAGVRRLGLEKLSVALTPGSLIAQGDQRREGYALQMSVYEAAAAGEPALPAAASLGGTRYEAIDWLPAASFRRAADQGSLCCRLFVEATLPAAP